MTITATATDSRVMRLRSILEERELDGMLVSRIANKRYFSGLRLMAEEESTWPGTLLITRDAKVLLADSRYTEQAEREAPGWEVILTTGGIGQDLPPILERLEVLALGMEAEVLTHADWAALAASAPGVELHAMDDEIVPLRLIKTDDELEAIGRACALGDDGFAHLVQFVQPGMTEKEVAWELEAFFRANGADGLAFPTIALAGPRAAMPHGQPSDTTIDRGNVLLLDFGCAVDGYRSDMTRTLFVGDVPDHVRRVHDAVRSAQSAAMESIAVGADGRDVDAIARRVITDAGFEPYGHGLGHGIGLEVHEPPSLRYSRAYTLEAGMVFSVEPGIYEPGVTGVRIEDIAVLEASGPRFLTNAPREPLVIG
jgi:Xaa-Pro aminopeptidase